MREDPDRAGLNPKPIGEGQIGDPVEVVGDGGGPIQPNITLDGGLQGMVVGAD